MTLTLACAEALPDLPASQDNHLYTANTRKSPAEPLPAHVDFLEGLEDLELDPEDGLDLDQMSGSGQGQDGSASSPMDGGIMSNNITFPLASTKDGGMKHLEFIR